MPICKYIGEVEEYEGRRCYYIPEDDLVMGKV
jgi:hypothetical protein